MKRLLLISLFIGTFISMNAISPYFLIGTLEGDISSIESRVENALSQKGFEVIGKYNATGSPEMRVIVFTSDELKKYCASVEDRGMLAAALKIGIRERKEGYQVTMVNPEYLFYLYLREEMENASLNNSLTKISENAKEAMKTVGSEMSPFGGDLKKDDLTKYKYMMGMPKFEDPVTLNEFQTFDEGLGVIRRNLEMKKGNTEKVFEIIDAENETAVFGVALLDADKGEDHFINIIGRKHIAAMPYEIILQGNTVTMLHGRFRFASHWPELTMGTFTKIMSSPGDVEDFMRAISK